MTPRGGQLALEAGDDDAAPGMADQLLELSEAEAVHRTMDAVNSRRLRQVLWGLVAVMGVYGIVAAAEGSLWRSGLAVAILGIDLLLLRYRRAGAIERNLRQTVAAVLIGHLVVLQLFHGDSSSAVVTWFVLIPMVTIRFRMASGETVSLFATMYAVLAVRLIVENLLMRQGLPLGSLVGFGVLYALCFATAWGLARRHERRFLVRWRAEAGRQRERLRMKQELEYARQIQLSMLPRGAPEVDWLDIAALSLPATEVGGDYYDYFVIDDDRLAVVVGDVTGHGMASGLVLSGVRSSLNLIQDDMVEPARVLERVNVMLKRTSTPRLLMTLAVALFDRSAGDLVVATAGHPPLLKRSTEGGRADEVGRGSFPLGAMLRAEYTDLRVPLEPGDILVLYSDGLVEMLDPEGRQYGWDRLGRVLDGCPVTDSARGVRDHLLRDLWDFKGDAEQVDDVTLVVIRVADA